MENSANHARLGRTCRCCHADRWWRRHVLWVNSIYIFGHIFGSWNTTFSGQNERSRRRRRRYRTFCWFVRSWGEDSSAKASYSTKNWGCKKVGKFVTYVEDEQVFFDNFYLLVCTAKLDNFFLPRNLVNTLLSFCWAGESRATKLVKEKVLTYTRESKLVKETCSSVPGFK